MAGQAGQRLPPPVGLLLGGLADERGEEGEQGQGEDDDERAHPVDDEEGRDGEGRDDGTGDERGEEARGIRLDGGGALGGEGDGPVGAGVARQPAG